MGNLCGKKVSKPIPFEQQSTDHSREKEPLLHSPPLPPQDPSPPPSPPSHTHDSYQHNTEVTTHRPVDDIPSHSKPPSTHHQHVDTQVIPLLPPPPSAHPSSSLIAQQSQEDHIPQQLGHQDEAQPPPIVIHTHTEVPVVIPPPRPPSPSPPIIPSSLSSSEEVPVVEVVREVQQDEEEEEEEELVVVTAKVQDQEQETVIVEAPQQSAKRLVTEEYTTAHIEQTPSVKEEKREDAVKTSDEVEATVQVIREEQGEATTEVIREDQEGETKEVITEDTPEVPEEDKATKEVIEENKEEVTEEVIAENKEEVAEEVIEENKEEVIEEEDRPVDEGEGDGDGEGPVADVREEISFDITADIPEETEMEMFKRLFQNDPETGFLERDRLQYILEVLGIMEGNVLEFIWDQFDADGSGEIDFKEFCQMMYQLRAIRKNFEAADVNGDKSISPAELVPVLNKLGITMEAQNIFDILKLFDANQDEEIDFSEFLPLSIFLTTLEHEYKEFINTRIARTKWLRPLLGGDIAKEEQVAEQMEALLADENAVPGMGDIVHIIVLAVNNEAYL